jgi:glutaredoxin
MNNVKVYGADWCEDTQRTREQLGALGVSYDYINLDSDKAAEEWAKAQNQGKRKTPTVDLEGTILIEPTNAQMEAALRTRGMIE